MARRLLVLLALLGSAGSARAGGEDPQPTRLHAEIDPFPFLRGGYGGQIGVRTVAAPRLRFALASFALDVPDLVAQLGNEGFHVRVRPSAALYVLYFLSGVRGGWVAGGSVRGLRLDYTHDDAPGEIAHVAQLSVEAIVGYKWHPWRAGFYLQPWVAVARTLAASDDAVVGGHAYDEPPVQLFATINLGWELECSGSAAWDRGP